MEAEAWCSLHIGPTSHNHSIFQSFIGKGILALTSNFSNYSTVSITVKSCWPGSSSEDSRFSPPVVLGNNGRPPEHTLWIKNVWQGWVSLVGLPSGYCCLFFLQLDQSNLMLHAEWDDTNAARCCSCVMSSGMAHFALQCNQMVGTSFSFY